MLKQININIQKFLVPLFDYLFGFALWGLTDFNDKFDFQCELLFLKVFA